MRSKSAYHCSDTLFGFLGGTNFTNIKINLKDAGFENMKGVEAAYDDSGLYVICVNIRVCLLLT
jgi:hypothetical protein